MMGESQKPELGLRGGRSQWLPACCLGASVALIWVLSWQSPSRLAVLHREPHHHFWTSPELMSELYQHEISNDLQTLCIG